MAPRVKDLVHKLILPLHLNETVFDRFTLVGAELAADDSRIVYTFAPTGLQLAVEPLSTRPSFAQTASFNLCYPSTGPAELARDENRLLEHIVSLIRSNDPGAVVWKSAPTLFLVPGVIGNPADLSLRAVDVLRRVPVILVEPGKESIVAELLTFHGIALGGKRVLPLPEDAGEVARRLDGLVAEDDDLCLFGADEGLPGFNDPGKSLLAAAAALGERLRVRTVGGPSALAMALLRIPLDLDRFLFFGVLEGDQPSVEELLRQAHDKPLILFLAANGDTIARRIAAKCLPAGRDVFLACNLTAENEMLIHLHPGDSVDALPVLDATTRVVLAVGPPPA